MSRWTVLVNLFISLIGIWGTAAPPSPNGGWGALWSPDGTKIAFLSAPIDEVPNLWVVEADGLNWRRLTGEGVQTFLWLDENHLLYRTLHQGQGVWHLVSIEGQVMRAPFPLPSNCLAVVPSPDGRWLACTLSHGKGAVSLWLYRRDGRQKRHLLTQWSIGRVVWSPRGDYLAFEGRYSPMSSAWHGRIWIYDLKGQKLARLNAVGALNPTWHPKGKRLAYSLAFPPKGFRIAVRDIETGRGKVLSEPLHTGEGLVWSPDGQWLALTVRETIKGVITSRIWVIRPDGEVMMTIGDETLMGRFPVWSPDGRRIAFEGQRRGESYASEVWVVEVATGRVKRLTPSFPSDWAPFPSPNGRWVAFFSTRTHRYQLWLATRGGMKAFPLLTVSPNAQICWTQGGGHLLVINRKDLTLVSLPPTLDDKAAPKIKGLIPPAPIIPYGASLSPDGQRIALITLRRRRPTLTVIDTKGKEHFNLSPKRKTSAPDMLPQWSPDGRFIAFVRDGKVWVVQRDGQKAYPIADIASPPKGNERVKILDLRWSSQGRWIVLSLIRGEDDPLSPPLRREFWVIETQGGKARKVYGETLLSLTDCFLTRMPIVLTPSGQLIFASARRGKAQIWTLDLERGTLLPLTDRRATYPAFLSNGQILFVSSDGQGTRIYLLDMAKNAFRLWSRAWPFPSTDKGGGKR